MKRLFFAITVVAAPLAPLTTLALTSCADTEDGVGGSSNPTPLPDGTAADADGGGDANADGGCDPSDPNCVIVPLSCDEVSWCPSPTGISDLHALTKVWSAGKNDVWAVGSGGTIVHWDGAAWTPSKAPPSPTEVQHTFFAVSGSGPKDVWIASSVETVFRNTGSGWVRERPPIEDVFQQIPVYSIWHDNQGAIRLGTNSFSYYDSEFNYRTGNQLRKASDHGGPDGGAEWAPTQGSGKILGFYGTADDLWYIADNSDRKKWQVALTGHGARTSPTEELIWTDVESNSLVRLNAIWGSSTNDIWAVGDQGAMRRMRPGLTSWEVVPPVTKESLYALWGTSATDIWAAGENGAILHYDGTAWTPDRAAFPAGKKKPHLTGIAGSGPDDVWIVGGAVALHYEGKKGAAK